MKTLFGSIYKDKTVLVTGHTGFKGSWLCLWLTQMGANVIGYSKAMLDSPNHYELLKLDIVSVFGDISDVDQTVKKYQPEIVFHLAAQSLVRYSYDNPIETFETNIMGTAKLFEAARKNNCVKAIVNITSDKAYDNKEKNEGYKEDDPMGGYDPYSSSKGCVELVSSSYRNSFFNLDEYKISHNTLIANCRSGNVIGGGDWAKDRLIPDIMRATSRGEKVFIRNPNSTRPWQHVLEPLNGYLLLGQRLLEEKKEFATSWNFGPNDNHTISVQNLVEKIKYSWEKVDYVISKNKDDLHEATYLKLNCIKAKEKLSWSSKMDSVSTIQMTVDWYREYYENGKNISLLQLKEYIKCII